MSTVCSTLKNHQTMLERVGYAVLRHSSDGHCKPNCLQRSQIHSIRQADCLVKGSRSSVMYLYFTEMEVEAREEVLLYDMGNIVAAVGGSLGLFLGFSCLDFAGVTLRFLVNRAQ